MHIQESGEMYLETIYTLTKERGNVRSIDVAEHMGYSKPSVSRAIGLLKKGGYVVSDGDGFLSLTPEGREALSQLDASWDELVGQIDTDDLKNILQTKEYAYKNANKIIKERGITLEWM